MGINRVFTITIVCIFVGTFANGAHVKFFHITNRGRASEALIYESSSTAKCNKIPQYSGRISHIISDSCHIVYPDDNCQDLCKRKVVSGQRRKGSKGTAYSAVYQSFHSCNNEAGGNQLNLDILDGILPLTSVIYSSRDLCSCVNMPSGMENFPKWYIDHYGNDFMVYFEPNCSEQRLTADVISTATHTTIFFSFIDQYRRTKIDNLTGSTIGIQSFGPKTDSEYFKASCNPHQMAVKQLAETAKLNKLLAAMKEQLDNRT